MLLFMVKDASLMFTFPYRDVNYCILVTCIKIEKGEQRSGLETAGDMKIA
uniref:Uncharacterized protein n=1 Tax=Arundo donax TaxID=35708 RepID=A0A0A9GP22_ARUDO